MGSGIIDYDHWNSQLTTLSGTYRANAPFPHICLDGFVRDPAFLRQAVAEFPGPEKCSVQYSHYNERRKYGFNDRTLFTGPLLELFQELESPRFVSFLSKLTGIPGLLADPKLEGGGLHLIEPGGFLNIHADFTTHHFRPSWRRRCNVLIYLNEHWSDSWGGKLELWNEEMSFCVQSFAPVFNRMVAFNTDETSYHGHPEPLRCPSGRNRKSIALYYYTGEEALKPRSTQYRARPDDPAGKKAMIRLDNWLIYLYSKSKRLFPRADRWVTRALKTLARR